MEINCLKCKAHLFKSYGSTYKLRSRSIRWDSLNDTAVVQCNMCRSFTNVPLILKVQADGAVLELGGEIKKSNKEKLVVQTTKKSEKKQS